jgi:hypothetical protein
MIGVLKEEERDGESKPAQELKAWDAKWKEEVKKMSKRTLKWVHLAKPSPTDGELVGRRRRVRSTSDAPRQRTKPDSANLQNVGVWMMEYDISPSVNANHQFNPSLKELQKFANKIGVSAKGKRAELVDRLANEQQRRQQERQQREQQELREREQQEERHEEQQELQGREQLRRIQQERDAIHTSYILQETALFLAALRAGEPQQQQQLQSQQQLSESQQQSQQPSESQQQLQSQQHSQQQQLQSQQRQPAASQQKRGREENNATVNPMTKKQRLELAARELVPLGQAQSTKKRTATDAEMIVATFANFAKRQRANDADVPMSEPSTPSKITNTAQYTATNVGLTSTPF